MILHVATVANVLESLAVPTVKAVAEDANKGSRLVKATAIFLEAALLNARLKKTPALTFAAAAVRDVTVGSVLAWKAASLATSAVRLGATIPGPSAGVIAATAFRRSPFLYLELPNN